MAEWSGYVYQCSAGETFDIVALQIYDDEKYACDLMNANPHLATTSVFDGTEELLLPVVEVDEDEQENEYAPASAPWKE